MTALCGVEYERNISLKLLKEKKYKELATRAKLADALEKECQRLADLITAETKDCKMGPWCKECSHRGVEYSQVEEDGFFGSYVVAEGGNVYYCKKHIHEQCPEFENRRK